MAKLINLSQGSDKWHEFRRVHIGSSDSPIVMGVSPWTTPFQLWEQKMSGIRPETTHVMQRGHDLENTARMQFEKAMNCEVFPCVFESEAHSFMSASLDGVSLDHSVIVEIKCAGKKDHAIAMKGQIPEKYKPQVQKQLCVMNADFLYYYSFDGKGGVCVKVFREEDYIKQLIQKETEFFSYMSNQTPPPLTERDQQNIKASKEWDIYA